MGKIGSHDVPVSSFAILALAVNKFPEIQTLTVMVASVRQHMTIKKWTVSGWV